jgi:hypothetical protein
MSGFLILLVLEHGDADSISAAELRAVIVAWAALAILYGIARWMKLSGRLGHG